jgi:hypothetical protein
VALFLLFALRTAVLILSALLDNLELIESVLKFLYLTNRKTLKFLSSISAERPVVSSNAQEFLKLAATEILKSYFLKRRNRFLYPESLCRRS